DRRFLSASPGAGVLRLVRDVRRAVDRTRFAGGPRSADARQHEPCADAQRARGARLRTRVLRDLGNLVSVQPARLGLREALRALDDRLSPGIRRAFDTDQPIV